MTTKPIELILPAAIVEELQALLAEAATEIANLDSPQNPVVKRLRKMRERLEGWAEDDNGN